MKLRSIRIVAAVLLLLQASNGPATAARYWRFFISVDGKPAFQGGTGASPFDRLETFVQGRVQLGPDSIYDETTVGDITLTGDVVFRAEDRSPLHLKRLRLIYEKDEKTRSSGTVIVDGFLDWRLHPDDAAAIVALYRRERTDNAAIRAAKAIGLVLTVTALVAFVLFRRKSRNRKDRSSSTEHSAGERRNRHRTLAKFWHACEYAHVSKFAANRA